MEVLGNAGYEVSVARVDASSCEAVHELVSSAASIGDVTGLIHAAGVSPSQASPSAIQKVDLYGTALVLEEFGSVITPLARDELTGPRGESCRKMIEGSPAGRAGIPDEVGSL